MSTELPETPDTESESFLDEDGVLYDDDVTPEYGILGFTLRELLIVGVWLVAFIFSFFPLVGTASMWATGIQWILPVGVPTVAVFLLVLRRFSPDGIRRVGSLGIDQFASVAFSVSAVVWVGTLWTAVAGLIAFGVFGLSWGGVVQVLASLALVVLTVFAPIIPGLKEDFQGRLVTLAHRNANPVRPVIARPRPEPAVPVAEADDAASDAVDVEDHDVAPTGVDPVSEPTPEPVALPVAAPTPEPVAAPAPEPVALPVAAPAPEPVAAPVAESAPETVAAPAPEPVAAPAPEPVAEPFPRAEEPPRYERPIELDVELTGNQATDEIARFDVADQVPLAAHASGGGTGTEEATAADAYVPVYSRRSRHQEIASDTGSIEALLGTSYSDDSDDTDRIDDTDVESVDTWSIDSAEAQDRTQTEAFGDDVDVDATNPRDFGSAPQPFWILAPTERDVHDERGEPLFRIGPTAWALVIEDRGGAFVVRHDDGRIGYLHDISDISKG